MEEFFKEILGLLLLTGTPIVAVWFTRRRLAAGRRRGIQRQVAAEFRRGGSTPAQQVARILGGAIVGDPSSRAARFHLLVDEIFAQVTYAVGIDSPRTRLAFSWWPSGRLRIAPEKILTRVNKFFGAQDIVLGDPAFDARFLIQGAPIPRVIEFLDAPTRRQVQALADLTAVPGSGDTLRIEAGPVGLIFSCARDLAVEEADLARFVQLSVVLLRRLRSLEPGSVAVLSVAEVAAQARCPVCGDRLQGAARRCAECKTLHHEECWTYLGGCALFACGGQEGERVAGE